jgi:hypothetical protein
MNIITKGLSTTKHLLVTKGLGISLVRKKLHSHGLPYGVFQEFLKKKEPIEFYVQIVGLVESSFEFEQSLVGTKSLVINLEYDVIGSVKKDIYEEIYISGIRDIVFEIDLLNLTGNKFIGINEEIKVKGKRDITPILTVMNLI